MDSNENRNLQYHVPILYVSKYHLAKVNWFGLAVIELIIVIISSLGYYTTSQLMLYCVFLCYCHISVGFLLNRKDPFMISSS